MNAALATNVLPLSSKLQGALLPTSGISNAILNATSRGVDVPISKMSDTLANVTKMASAFTGN